MSNIYNHLKRINSIEIDILAEQNPLLTNEFIEYQKEYLKICDCDLHIIEIENYSKKDMYVIFIKKDNNIVGIEDYVYFPNINETISDKLFKNIYRELINYFRSIGVEKFKFKFKDNRIEKMMISNMNINKIDIEEEYFIDLTSYKTNQIRKSYKQLVKKSQDLLEIKFTKEFEVDKYIKMHEKVAGKITRSRKTWQIQNEMFNNNQLDVIEASYNDIFLGFAFFNKYKSNLNYSVGVYDRDYFDIPISHGVLDFAINEYKKLSYTSLKLGKSKINEMDEKLNSINMFKKGFMNKNKMNFIVDVNL